MELREKLQILSNLEIDALLKEQDAVDEAVQSMDLTALKHHIFKVSSQYTEHGVTDYKEVIANCGRLKAYFTAPYLVQVRMAKDNPKDADKLLDEALALEASIGKTYRTMWGNAFYFCNISLK